MNKFKLLLLSLCFLLSVNTNMGYATPFMKDNHVDGPEMMLKQQQMMLRGLGPADENYDLRFLNMMIIHHQGAVDMARDVLKKSKHKELKTMANNIINSQSKEIEQMKIWKKQWYNK